MSSKRWLRWPHCVRCRSTADIVPGLAVCHDCAVACGLTAAVRFVTLKRRPGCLFCDDPVDVDGATCGHCKLVCEKNDAAVRAGKRL